MKKLVSLIIAMSIFFSINCAIFATNVSYMADFESADAKFGNSTTYSGLKTQPAIIVILSNRNG